MSRELGTFPFSANFELKKKGVIDARQYVDNYSDLLTFTEANYIAYGFPVVCGGADDETKRGLWICVDEEDLSNPASWERSGVSISDEEITLLKTYSSKKIEDTFLPRLNSKSAVGTGDPGDVGIVLSPKGATYGEGYSFASGTKVIGVLRIKLPLAYGNCIMKIEGSISRLGPTELIKFRIGGYWSGGYSDGAGGYRNWWSIDSATWERALTDLNDIPLRFGYELDDPENLDSTKHAVIYIGTTTTDWGVNGGFFIDKIYCSNSDLSVDNTKDWEVNVIDDDSAIIYNQSTVMLVPTEPVSFVDKVLSGCDLTFTESDTKVSVGAGYYNIAGTTYNPPAMEVPFDVPEPDAELPRYDIITGTQNKISDNDSYYKYYTGIASESAVPPVVPEGEILIRPILVTTAGTEPSPPDLSGYMTKSGGNTATGTQDLEKVSLKYALYWRAGRQGNSEQLLYRIEPYQPLNNNLYFTNILLGYLNDLIWIQDTGVFDFRLKPTVGGSPLALQSAVDLKLDSSAYNQHYKGKFTSLANLQTAFPTASAGDYAQVDEGTGSDVVNYNWDDEDGWIEGGSGSAATTTDELPEGSSNLYLTSRRVTDIIFNGITVGYGVDNIGFTVIGSNGITINDNTDYILQIEADKLTLSNQLETINNVISNISVKISDDANKSAELKSTGLILNTKGNAGGESAYIKSDNVVNNVTLQVPNKSTGTYTLATTADIVAPTLAADADLQTQTTPTEDNKITSRRGLIYYFNWLKTQVVNITNRWQFTGIGLGTAGVANAFLAVAASTSAIASFLITFGASYTNSVSGSVWAESVGYRLRMLRGTLTSDFLFSYDNYLYKGVSTRIGTFNEQGDLSAVIALEEGFAMDSDVVTAITGATYTSDRATITPANDKVFSQGQMYDDGTYTYLAIDDNSVRRW